MEASQGVGVAGRVTASAGFRLGALTLAVTMALGLSACGGGGGGGNVKPTQPSSPPPSTGGTTPAGREIDVAANSAQVRADVLGGTDGLIKGGTGVLTLSGTNTYTGTTQVQAGSLYIDGDQTAATGATSVASGATLGGKGIVGGAVSVADGGTLAPGSYGTAGTLAINGDLSLASGATVAYDVGDSVWIKGNLTLDGSLTLNATSSGLLGPGVTRLFNIGGNLVDNGLTTPSGVLVQTAISHQVNLVNTQGMAVSFWDGDAGPKNDHAIQGGNGTWQGGAAGANTNWTDANGAANAAFTSGAFAVFQGAPGTVTVDASKGDVHVGGMQFAANGYVVQGDALHLDGSASDPTHSVIRVGDGSADGAGYTATIDSTLTGNAGLVKSDAGTLILGSDNTYAGGTLIIGGTLQLGHGGTTGSIVGNVIDDAILAFNRSDVVTFGGAISGTGALTQAGEGTLILAGNNTYTGGTTISDGTLQVGNGGTSGWITGNIVNNQYLTFNRSDDVVFGGTVTGTGALTKDGAGKLTLTGSFSETGSITYLSPTTITAGTLQVGNGGTTGSIAGDIENNGALIFDRSDTYLSTSNIHGTGTVTQAGTGTLILANYVGSSNFFINQGTVQVGNGATTAAILGDIVNNGTLILNTGPVGTYTGTAGVISGSGKLIKTNTGEYSLDGNNTYTGGTLISAGTLTLGTGVNSNGWIVGDVTDNGTLNFQRSDNVTFTNQVTGSGVVAQSGRGTLTLTGDFRNTGGVEITTGTLQIGDGGTTGSLVGNVVNNGTLIFNRSDDQTFASNISGSGGFIKLGSNTLTYTGSSTASGGGAFYAATSVTDGTLRLASGASLGFRTLVGGNLAHATLQIDRGATAAYILLNDGATLDNAGLVHFNDPFNALSGGAATVINHDGGIIETVPVFGYVGAALGLGANSTLTNTSGAIIRGAVGVDSGGIVNNDGATISGVTDDGVTGTFTVLNNTHGGMITSGSDNPPYNFAVSNGVFSTGENVTINNLSASSIIGKGKGVTLENAGTLNNDGGSIISAVTGVSTYNLFDAHAVSTINNTNGAKITGSKTGIYLTFGGVVNNGAGSTIETTAASTGDCSVSFACAIYVPVYPGVGSWGSDGKFTLTNAGTILGDVQMDPGLVNDITLVSGGSIHGALKIGTNAQSSLTLDGGVGTTQSYSGAVTGATTFAGHLVKNGGGTWILDNNPLGNVLNTTINAGSLRATQALPGNVTTNAGGTLDGVPGVNGSLTNGGKVAVHGGTTTVGGNFTQTAGGTLAVSLGSALSVAGTANLAGTLEVTGADTGYTSDTHTTVLTAAGGVTGAFLPLVVDSGVVFTSHTIHQDANNVWLDTTGLNITAAMQSRGAVMTRASMASAERVQSAFTQLDSKIATGTVSEVPTAYVQAAGQFQQAPTVEAAQTSLQSLSGQLHAASAAMTFEAIDASSRALSDHFDDLLSKKSSVGMWTSNLSMGGGMGRTGYDAVGFQLNGWMVGSDQQIGSSGVAGFAFGQSQGQQQLDQSSDHNRSRNTEGMIYAGAFNGNWYTQGRVGFGHFQQDVNRQLFLGVSAQGVGTEYGGDYSVAYGETGLNLDWAGTRIIPFVNAEYANIRRDGFAEQGAGGFGLQANAQTLDRWQAGAGLRASRHWDFGGGRALDFRVSAQFERTLASRGDVFEASFVGLQQWQPLVGVGLSRYSGVLNVGLKANLSARTSLDFGYDYQSGQRDQAKMVSARWVTTF
ncbi:autotransporter-associated beta strand repeat-containing protein [Luteibacter aegosomaticola]|uniref:autotransporter domain-containing protein n=1 Tax=Luteibacter aegosomaticola TaxID=2911538 RepID=UPI001FFA52E6|nr:autotransporter domain-containing protein [Luteibacter aegosomaticola]UPG92194.1 autotransporter-associated beta strand repeat-containing protein [Luteibacter aegosomaticola]